MCAVTAGTVLRNCADGGAVSEIVVVLNFVRLVYEQGERGKIHKLSALFCVPVCHLSIIEV